MRPDRCGTNPNAQLTPGDKAAVDQFQAVLRIQNTLGCPPAFRPDTLAVAMAAFQTTGGTPEDAVAAALQAVMTAPHALRDLLLRHAALTPCHITGEHSPDHHPRYTCNHQRANTLEKLLAFACVEESNLPRRLHDDTCTWCHAVPSQEEFRVKLRASYQWAGVPIPDELAALAPDAPRPDDDQMVRPFIGADWTDRGAIFDAVKAAHPRLPGTRIGHGITMLVEAGAVEEHGCCGSGSYRLAPAT